MDYNCPTYDGLILTSLSLTKITDLGDIFLFSNHVIQIGIKGETKTLLTDKGFREGDTYKHNQYTVSEPNLMYSVSKDMEKRSRFFTDKREWAPYKKLSFDFNRTEEQDLNSLQEVSTLSDIASSQNWIIKAVDYQSDFLFARTNIFNKFMIDQENTLWLVVHTDESNKEDLQRKIEEYYDRKRDQEEQYWNDHE